MIPLQEIKLVPLEPGHHCSVLRLAGGAVDGHIPGDVQLDGQPGMYSVEGKIWWDLGLDIHIPVDPITRSAKFLTYLLHSDSNPTSRET